jgi:hypothetical protein
MSATPAAQLARLRRIYGAAWRIDRQPGHYQQAASGPGWGAPDLFVAVQRDTGVALTDATAVGLESKILATDSNHRHGPRRGNKQ